MKQSWDELFSQGIGAVRDVLVARESNDPTPNNRGSNDVTAPAGSPAVTGIASVAGGVAPWLLLAGVAVVVYLIVRK